MKKKETGSRLKKRDKKQKVSHLICVVNKNILLNYINQFIERSREAFSSKIEKNIKKKKKNNDGENGNDDEEIESQKKMQRVANFQARSAKNKMKPKKMNAMSDFDKGMYKI